VVAVAAVLLAAAEVAETTSCLSCRNW